MKHQWKPPDGAKLLKLLEQYKYVLIVIVVGAALLLWPTGERPKAEAAGREQADAEEEFDLEGLEAKLSRVLSQVEGAGEVTVALTVRSGMERVLASDRSSSRGTDRAEAEEETVILSGGSGEEVVVVTRNYPVFQGAVVVCQGADDPEVRLLLTQAVSALTGLGSDRITICKGG